MHRREFLAASLVGCVGANLAAGDEASRVTFGFSLYGMRALTLDAALEGCAKIGYDAVELALMPGWPAEPRRLSAAERRGLRQRLRNLRLTLPAVMENTPLDGDAQAHRSNLARLQAAMQLGSELATDSPPVIETVLGGKPGQWEQVRRQFAQRLADWANLAEKHKTVICLKPHRFGAVNLPEHVSWLLREAKSPWLKAAFDYSHYEHRNLSLADTLKTLLPHTRFIHVKDSRIANDRVQFVLPGDGRVDYAAYFRQLAAARWSGCVCVEVSGMLQNQKGYDPIAAARRSYQNLAPVFQKAGLRRP